VHVGVYACVWCVCGYESIYPRYASQVPTQTQSRGYESIYPRYASLCLCAYAPMRLQICAFKRLSRIPQFAVRDVISTLAKVACISSKSTNDVDPLRVLDANRLFLLVSCVRRAQWSPCRIIFMLPSFHDRVILDELIAGSQIYLELYNDTLARSLEAVHGLLQRASAIDTWPKLTPGPKRDEKALLLDTKCICFSCGVVESVRPDTKCWFHKLICVNMIPSLFNMTMRLRNPQAHSLQWSRHCAFVFKNVLCVSIGQLCVSVGPYPSHCTHMSHV